MLKQKYFIALLLIVAAFFVAKGVEAVLEATIGGIDSSGNYRWTCEDGNLVPGADASYTIGSTSNKPSMTMPGAFPIPTKMQPCWTATSRIRGKAA